jgi:FkbM family methyltransferase
MSVKPCHASRMNSPISVPTNLKVTPAVSPRGLTSLGAGLTVRALRFFSRHIAYRFALWYYRMVLLYPRWCGAITYEPHTHLADGSKMQVAYCDVPGMVIATTGSWEPHLTKRILNRLKPGDLFVDAGANRGFYTIQAAKAVGSEGLVFTFEPSIANLRALCGNIARNQCSNVVIFSIALCGESSISKLSVPPPFNSGLSTLRVGTGQYTRSATFRLDDLFSLLRPAAPLSVIKIDVEGLELEVLRGMERILRDNIQVAVACEVNPGWCAGDDLLRFMRGLGFEGEYFDGNQWRKLGDTFTPKDQCDTWFVRP